MQVIITITSQQGIVHLRSMQERLGKSTSCKKAVPTTDVGQSVEQQKSLPRKKKHLRLNTEREEARAVSDDVNAICFVFVMLVKMINSASSN